MMIQRKAILMLCFIINILSLFTNSEILHITSYYKNSKKVYVSKRYLIDSDMLFFGESDLIRNSENTFWKNYIYLQTNISFLGLWIRRVKYLRAINQDIKLSRKNFVKIIINFYKLNGVEKSKDEVEDYYKKVEKIKKIVSLVNGFNCFI